MSPAARSRDCNNRPALPSSPTNTCAKVPADREGERRERGRERETTKTTIDDHADYYDDDDDDGGDDGDDDDNDDDGFSRRPRV